MQGDKQKILAIDDEPMVLNIVARMLSASGYDVCVADGGPAALEAFAAERPDLVLCDLRMPDMDGLEVLAAVAERSPSTPFLLMSGVGQISDAVEALKLGAWDYLVKPIHSAAALACSVKKAFDRAGLLQQNEAYRQQLELTNVELARSVVDLEREIRDHRHTHQELLATQEQARSLTLQLAVSEENERRRIAQHLHEEVAQVLAMSQLKLYMLRELPQPSDASGIIAQVNHDLDEVIAQLRSLTFDLCPPALADMGLATAVGELARELVAQSNQEIALEIEEEEAPESLALGERAIIYRAARELIWNVLKHARATRLKVSVNSGSGALRVEVLDDGVGLDRSRADRPPDGITGIGLHCVAERLRHLGGKLEIASGTAGGVRASLLVPLRRAAAAPCRGQDGPEPAERGDGDPLMTIS